MEYKSDIKNGVGWGGEGGGGREGGGRVERLQLRDCPNPLLTKEKEEARGIGRRRGREGRIWRRSKDEEEGEERGGGRKWMRGKEEERGR